MWDQRDTLFRIWNSYATFLHLFLFIFELPYQQIPLLRHLFQYCHTPLPILREGTQSTRKQSDGYKHHGVTMSLLLIALNHLLLLCAYCNSLESSPCFSRIVGTLEIKCHDRLVMTTNQQHNHFSETCIGLYNYRITVTHYIDLKQLYFATSSCSVSTTIFRQHYFSKQRLF